MPTKTQRKNLGRGLSALIPDADMAFLSQIARGDDKTPKVAAIVKNRSKKSKSSLVSLEVKSETPNLGAALAQEENSTNTDSQNAATYPSAKNTDLNGVRVDFVPLDKIEANPYQPRRSFSPDELAELSDSLKEHGLLQPIILRPLLVPDGNQLTEQVNPVRYQLVAGERRWRAAQMAGLVEVPAIVREVSDQQALELALIENVQRHDISALDAAVAYRRLSQEFSLSQEQVAHRVGKSRSSIANTIRLLDLPVEAQKAIEEGSLTEGHGRAILLAPTDGARRAVLRRVLRDKLSVRDAEELARQTVTKETGADSDDDSGPEIRLSPEARRIEEGLQKHLGTRVKLKLKRQGGQILIQYFSNEELDRVLKLIMK